MARGKRCAGAEETVTTTGGYFYPVTVPDHGELIIVRTAAFSLGSIIIRFTMSVDQNTTSKDKCRQFYSQYDAR